MPRFSLTQLRYQFSHYQQRRRSRRQLLTLDDHLLKDIGITREQACQEGKKTLWKPMQQNKSAATTTQGRD